MDNSNTNKKVKIGKILTKRKQISEYEEKLKNNEKLILNDYNNDFDKLRKIYMNINFEHNTLYTSRIKEKINSYLYQDKKKTTYYKK